MPSERPNRRATSASPTPTGASQRPTEGDLAIGEADKSGVANLAERTSRFLVPAERAGGYGLVEEEAESP